MAKTIFKIFRKIKQILLKDTRSQQTNVSTDQDIALTDHVNDVENQSTPTMVRKLKHLLEQNDYRFVYHHPTETKENFVHHITMQMSDKDRDWACLIRFLDNKQLLVVYSIFPFHVPESHRSDMIAVITHINYDLILGNLEMDLQDGELRFKTSIDIEVTGLNQQVLSYLLQSNFSIFSQLFDTLSSVIEKDQPAETISQAINALLYHEQEKAFYVMSEKIQ